MKFILPFPPSVNSKYQINRGKRRKSDKDKEWIKAATDAINEQNILPFSGRCYIIYELCHPDNRPRDDENYLKKTTDLLVSLNIIAGDERRYKKGTFVYWNDKPGDYIIVRIIPVDKFDISELINKLDSLT